MKKKFLQLKIHPVSLAVFAGSFLFLDSSKVLSAAAALILHETAHLMAARLCGFTKCTVEITPFGGMIDAEHLERQSALKQLMCVAAGILANGCAALICIKLAPRTPFWYQFLCANVSLAGVNLLPLWPLDGARTVYAAAGWIGVERQARKLLLILTYLAAGIFLLIALYGAWIGAMNLSLLLAGPYLLYAAGMERVANGVRLLGVRRDHEKRVLTLPASVWVGIAEHPSEQFGLFLAKQEHGRYGIYVQLEPSSGRIERIWTEDEVREQVFRMPEIDDGKT